MFLLWGIHIIHTHENLRPFSEVLPIYQLFFNSIIISFSLAYRSFFHPVFHYFSFFILWICRVFLVGPATFQFQSSVKKLDGSAIKQQHVLSSVLATLRFFLKKNQQFIAGSCKWNVSVVCWNWIHQLISKVVLSVYICWRIQTSTTTLFQGMVFYHVACFSFRWIAVVTVLFMLHNVCL